MTPSPKHVAMELMAPSTAGARQVLRWYMDEVVSRLLQAASNRRAARRRVSAYSNYRA
jgi:hypothetical protein